MTSELAGKKILTTRGLPFLILLKDKKKPLGETCFSRMLAGSFSFPPCGVGVLAAEPGLGDSG